MKDKRFLKIPVLCCIALMSLTACEGVRLGATSLAAREVNFFQNPDVNLISKNYAAADYIIQQAETFIDEGDRIRVAPLVNFDDPETPAPIGALLPEQIGTRFTQLGYDVDLTEVSAAKEHMKMSDVVPLSSAKTNNPDFVLTGHYRKVAPKNFILDKAAMQVSLRIVETKTDRVVGAFDYTMPTNREIRKLSEPKPQIIRMTQ